MSRYQDALSRTSVIGGIPLLDALRNRVQEKLGGGIAVEQDWPGSTGRFFRASWADGKTKLTPSPSRSEHVQRDRGNGPLVLEPRVQLRAGAHRSVVHSGSRDPLRDSGVSPNPETGMVL